MIVEDLVSSDDLDQAALAAVSGGGIACREYLGSKTCYTGWTEHGEKRKRFLGNVYVCGKGWFKKYRTVKKWSRKEIYKERYNIMVCC